MQFRGCDTSTNTRIINKIPLKYCSITFLRTFVAIVLTIVGGSITLVLYGFSIKLLHFIPMNPIVLEIIVFMISSILSLKLMSETHNKIFNKQISLYDESKIEFMLCINSKEMLFKKKDIKKVILYRIRDHHNNFIQGTLLLKVDNQIFRFSSKKNFNYLLSMEQHLKSWKTS